MAIGAAAMLLPVSDASGGGATTAPASAMDWSTIVVSPAQAATTASMKADSLVRSMVLRKVLDTLVYAVRLTTGVTVFVDAATGRTFRMTDSLAANIAKRGLAGMSVDHVERTAARTNGYRGALPAWRVSFDDAAGTEAYVTEATGTVARTTQRDRLKATLVQNLHHFARLEDFRGGARVRKALLWATCLLTIVYVILSFWLALPHRIRGFSRPRSQT
jgi:hypothetical protein